MNICNILDCVFLSILVELMLARDGKAAELVSASTTPYPNYHFPETKYIARDEYPPSFYSWMRRASSKS